MTNKRKRTPKRSNGINGGGGKTNLTAIQKVLLGGGIFRSMKPVGSPTKPPKKQPAADGE